MGSPGLPSIQVPLVAYSTSIDAGRPCCGNWAIQAYSYVSTCDSLVSTVWIRLPAENRAATFLRSQPTP